MSSLKCTKCIKVWNHAFTDGSIMKIATAVAADVGHWMLLVGS